MDCFVVKAVRTYTAWHLTFIMRQSCTLGEYNARGKAFLLCKSVSLERYTESYLERVKRRLPPVPVEKTP